MAQITPHFHSNEFDCKDGTPYPEEWIEERLRPLCEALEVLRAVAGFAIDVNSGYRTPKYNASLIGSASHSQHTLGNAADIVIKTMPAYDVHTLIRKLIKEKRMPDGGLGKYAGFTHYDTRGYKARW